MPTSLDIDEVNFQITIQLRPKVSRGPKPPCALFFCSRHSHVAPKLPQEATVYIVAPHKLFVANLLPMTFFLLLLAFTDGTARTAEVLPRDALMRQVPGVRPGEFAWVLDTSEVESYVYDSSLPAFKR